MAETPASNEKAQPTQADNSGPELNVQDLLTIKNIIEVAAQRGAFKANEFESVGRTYNKLEQFLAAASQGGNNG